MHICTSVLFIFHDTVTVIDTEDRWETKSFSFVSKEFTFKSGECQDIKAY